MKNLVVVFRNDPEVEVKQMSTNHYQIKCPRYVDVMMLIQTRNMESITFANSQANFPSLCKWEGSGYDATDKEDYSIEKLILYCVSRLRGHQKGSIHFM